mgnify:CR=1 FL=1
MAEKILIVATVANHIKAFHIPYIEFLKSRGYQVEVACAPDRFIYDIPTPVHQIFFSRFPFSLKNIKAYLAIKKIISEENYRLIHVHTPIAAFLVRLAARKYKTPVIYTAHGFHFYKGAPIFDNFLFKFIETLAARWTTCLIVINEEDLQAAKTMGYVPGENLFYIPGVGVNLDYYQLQGSTKEARQELGISDDVPMVLCAAEFSPNKNHILLLDAWEQTLHLVPDAVLVLAGFGQLETEIKEKIKDRDLEHSVFMIGYRYDLPRFLHMADVVVLPSKREGLPRAILEAMACAKPVVATNIRGNRDLVEDGKNGFLVPLHSPEPLARALALLLTDRNLAAKMGTSGREMADEYSLSNVIEQNWDLYKRFL